jgi:hypothetical protein
LQIITAVVRRRVAIVGVRRNRLKPVFKPSFFLLLPSLLDFLLKSVILLPQETHDDMQKGVDEGVLC